ncbi:MerR family transcriptional regulator [Tsukamurella sp. NPDC003166]|uniref:MerR family transcriptional regulator n=1 Tax=Tsukamurella sp. NPDC003166 TaxID=3154444 RepID=UPI0033BF876F
MDDHAESHGGGWKIGDLAERTGVTVRTLRYYDQTGLLIPDGQTRGGHRVYGVENIERLYRILALRRLGFRLAEIGSLLDAPTWDLGAMLTRHLADTDRTVAAATRLAAELRAITGQLGRGEVHPQALLEIIEEMTRMEPIARNTTTLLVYEDLAAAHTYLAETFGLTPGPLVRLPDGVAVHGELLAGDHAIWLHPTGEGYSSPRHLGGVSSMTVISVDDADPHHARTVARGADIVEEPTTQPYGVREYGVRDPEGHLWYFHGPVT